MSKSLSNLETGKLRWAKLKELEDNGQLGFARDRQDILTMMGVPKGYGRHYGWLASRIKAGNISETLLGFGADNKPEYEYHIIKEPDYDPSSRTTALNQKRKQKRTASNASVKVSTEQLPSVPSGNTKMVIRYNDLVIELENVASGVVENIVEKLASR